MGVAPSAVVALDFCQQIGSGSASDDSATTLEDERVTINFLANDSCYGSSWALTNVSPLAHGGLAPGSQSSFVYVPDPDWSGTETFTYHWHSYTYDWDSNDATVTVTVKPVNDPPYVAQFSGDCLPGGPPPLDELYGPSVAEDSGPYSTPCLVVRADFGGTELDQNVHVVVSVDHPELFAAGPSTANIGPVSGLGNTAFSLSFTPAPNAYGLAKVTLTPKDDGGKANGGQDTGTPIVRTISIAPVNDAPMAKDDSYSTAYGTVLVVPANKGVLHNDTDIDGPSLTASLKTPPTHGVVSLNGDGSFTYTPTSGYSGSDTFTYDVSDGSLSDTANVKVTVLAAEATSGPTAPAEPSPTATTAPSATASPQASTGPTASMGASPTSSPTASGEPVAIVTGETAIPSTPPSAPTSGTGSSDPPWLAIIAVVLILVIGSNVALYQVLARRHRDGP